VVDDDASVTTTLSLLLRRHGYEPICAAGPDEALEQVRKENVALVLQDMNFSVETSGREGLDLLRRIKALRHDLPVVLVTAWGSIALAVEGVKAGAADFMTKPWSNDHVIQSIETALSLAAGAGDRRERQPPPRRADLDAKYDLSGLIGEDPELLRLLDLIGRVGSTNASVLITGESGTGKELVAEALHRNSPRRAAPFVKVNLGGISSTLFESEMFGHVRGAFTDAGADRSGRFERADGGTIFLDEIGDLDLPSQVKLLRVLQDRTYEVLGSSVTRSVEVRVVSATNRDLGQAVADGSFREDLLYRLNLIAVKLPPLRDRPKDIPVLADRFLQACVREYRRGPSQLTAEAYRWLAERKWPGNIRQLKQAIERAVLVVDGDTIDAIDLDTLGRLEGGETSQGTLPQPGSMTLDELERAMIVNCMKHYDGNVSRAASALGLSRAALYRRMEKFGLAQDG
jgi:two-component system NtrC family response regulator